MTSGYMFLGALIGVLAAAWGEHPVLGLIGGGVIGLLLARLVRLERAVRDLQSPQFRHPPAPSGSAATAKPTGPEASPAAAPVSTTAADPPPATVREPHWSDWDSPSATETAIDANNTWEQRSLEPSLLQLGLGKIRHWFTHGNVPVKVGVLVSFVGFSFLLKYAVDQKLIFLPLELRLLGVALVGMVLLGLGWRLRRKAPTYALSLQGGGLGILFLTVFAAFRVWSLITPGLAFILLVGLAITTGVLAMVQNARMLAIFGVAGGFLAPLLTSTGEGSHVMLFSYYLVINGAVFGLAWFRAWRGLNLIGWVFTFVIGSFWGYQYYRPGLFASTEPFLVLHFLLYNTIAVLFAQRQRPERKGLVDGALVFGTPVVSFALQAALLSDSEYGLAISAVAMAIFYAATSLLVLRRRGQALQLLSESFNALAVVFATLAIPLAFDARWTAAAWALEGAALVWIGIRQPNRLASLAGTLLIFGSGVAFWEYGWKTGRGMAVLNGNVLGGVLISLSALFSSRQLGKYTSSVFAGAHRVAGFGLFLWGAAWWLGVGLIETLDRPTRFSESHTYLLVLSASLIVSISLGEKLGWSRMRRLGSVLLPILIVLGALNFLVEQHAMFGLGWLAWPAAFAVLGRVLKSFDQHREPFSGAWHLGSILLLTALLSNESWWQVDQLLSRAWAGAAGPATAGIVALLLWRTRRQEAWPAQRHPATYLDATILIVTASIIYLTALNITQPGDPEPLFYLPVFNPFDLALIAAAGLAWRSLEALRYEALKGVTSVATEIAGVYRLVLAAAFFVLTTAALVRGVHQLTGVSWNWDSLFASVIVQASLSIYWGLLGFIGMTWGARRGQRVLWLTGAGFMALVVLKLFVVDLTQTGTIERIVSFIGVGILLLVVGYFAPAPPRASDPGRDA